MLKLQLTYRQQLEQDYKDGVKYLIAVHMKNDIFYLDATTFDLLCKSALNLLIQRLNSEKYYVSFEPPETPKTPLNQVFEDEQMTKFNKSQWNLYNYLLNEHKRNEFTLKQIREAVDTKDGWKAWLALIDRKSFEYEKVSLEELCQPEDL